MRKMTILLIVSLFLVFTLVGCNKTSQSKEDAEKFIVDKAVLEERGGACVKRGNDYYTIMGWLPEESGDQFGIGIQNMYSNAVSLYWNCGDEVIISSDDFSPIVIKRGEKILDYGPEIEFYPVEYVGYSPLFYYSEYSRAVYLDDGKEVNVFDYNIDYSIFDQDGNSIEYGNFQKGEQYAMRWSDETGMQIVTSTANGRMYKPDMSNKISITLDDKDEYYEYDTSDLSPGLYYIKTSQRGGIITIE